MLEYRQKKKQLIILDCIPKNFDINRLKGEHSDLLAITGEVVVHLSCNGYEFLTLNKIYSSADYRKDTDIFMKRMNYFLESCDFIWNLRCGFEYPFSGNEHCFSTWFTDLLFINTISEKKETFSLTRTLTLPLPQPPTAKRRSLSSL